MSRIANQPIPVPSGVTVSIEAYKVTVKGPNGSLQMDRIGEGIDLSQESDNIVLSYDKEDPEKRMFAGTTRALLANNIQGVHTLFEKALSIIGVGYRANVQGSKVNLSLGYSHPIDYDLPEGITAKVTDRNLLTISGASKQVVGQVAAEIRALRSVEPYQGKGIRYLGEHVIRKEAKKTK